MDMEADEARSEPSNLRSQFGSDLCHVTGATTFAYRTGTVCVGLGKRKVTVLPIFME